MDPSNHKDFTTSRGLNYHYYFSAPKDNKPTLLFIHGFPSLAFEWENQVSYLQNLGYGLIVPDMLGYGGTAKPTDPQQYAKSLIVNDLIDILDAEKVGRCVAIGHDWGSQVTGRIANYYHDRFLAFGFFAVGYFPPNTTLSWEEQAAYAKQLTGRDSLGYQAFLSSPDGAELCEKNIDSFLALLHARDAETLWIDVLGTHAATRDWIEGDERAELNPNIPTEAYQRKKEALLKGGLQGAVCWYKVMTSDIDAKDNAQLDPKSYIINKPVFLGLALRDSVALPTFMAGMAKRLCKNLTIKEFDATHWVMWDKKDEVNSELAAWLESLESAT